MINSYFEIIDDIYTYILSYLFKNYKKYSFFFL